MAPLATWQAYNDWGGLSLYHGRGGGDDFAGRSFAVSFDRPYAAGVGEFFFTAMPLVAFSERLDIRYAYLSDLDLDLDANESALHGSSGAVLFGHAEYLSTTIRSRLTQARDGGTNVLFTGANSTYWRIRLADGLVSGAPRGLVISYKSAALDPRAATDPANATVKWKDAPGANPTQSFLGMRYECYPGDADLVVSDAAWWGYAEAMVRNGDAFPHLVGSEADRFYPGGATPSPVQIVANSPYR
ncbi:MAG TPA: hypothetical protein P5181_11355 [Dermatophilaceae bacterium]|nr:hypothetical protein [Dermatophilaceae bacterium]